MSHYSKNTCNQRTAVIDHEKQFQEDLERAQALSLESLALEKFRLQKLRSEFSTVQQVAQDNVCNTNSAASETNGSQGERSIAFFNIQKIYFHLYYYIFFHQN